MADSSGAQACARTRTCTHGHARAIRPMRVARAAAVAVAVLLAGSAAAQTVTPDVELPIDPTAAAMPPDRLDFSLLDDAASTAPITRASIPPPASLLSRSATTIGSRTYKLDGSMTMSAGERMAAPWDANWDAKVGVDLAAPAGAGEDHGTGWANVALPAARIGLDQATIDARIDPSSDQGKLSTALSRSVPIGDGLSLTLQNGYSVTQTLANPNGMPAPANPRVYVGNGGVRLQFPTATALTAGAQMSSMDDRLTPSLSAEQKLFDTPLSITGTISQLPTGETDRSIMAGFRRTW
jgi:hypothetical protein